MPFNNRYVVAAIDTDGDTIAVLSPSSEWITSLPDAICFSSQYDANQYIEKEKIGQNTRLRTQELKNFHHVGSFFVEVENNNAVESEHVPENVINFAGIYG